MNKEEKLDYVNLSFQENSLVLKLNLKL